MNAEFFRPPLDYPRIPYDQMLSHGAARHPENVAVVFRDVSLTYRELEALTNRFAHALLALGVAKGDRVCVLAPNCPEYLIAFYAIARVGAVASPMNPSYREREIEYQLNDTEAVAIVVHTNLVSLVDAVRERSPHLKHLIAVGPGQSPGSRVRSFTELIADQPSTPPAPVEILEDDLVALPYSSGTTGLPKGVMISHKNLVTNNIQFVACIRMRESDRLMLFLPFYHIYGTMLMGAAVHTGATCVLMERFEPVECLELVQRHRVTLFFVVPPVLLMLSNWPELAKYDLSSLRTTMVGAAPVAPEPTAAALRDGWYYSGDIGYVDERGYLYIRDRKKEMIKFKGFGIAPAEIEALLVEHPAVADAAVIGKPHPEAGEIPKAFVVRKKGQDLTAADVVAFVKGRLANYKVPGEVEFVDAIPKTPSGKILRRVLKEQELGKR